MFLQLWRTPLRPSTSKTEHCWPLSTLSPCAEDGKDQESKTGALRSCQAGRLCKVLCRNAKGSNSAVIILTTGSVIQLSFSSKVNKFLKFLRFLSQAEQNMSYICLDSHTISHIAPDSWQNTIKLPIRWNKWKYFYVVTLTLLRQDIRCSWLTPQ